MKNAIGRNTTTAIQAGIFFGYVGLVDNIVEKMIEESGEQNVKVVATGGLASLIISQTKNVRIVDKNLTLEGLRMIYEKNTQSI